MFVGRECVCVHVVLYAFVRVCVYVYVVCVCVLHTVMEEILLPHKSQNDIYLYSGSFCCCQQHAATIQGMRKCQKIHKSRGGV